jgi:hypothetical protein
MGKAMSKQLLILVIPILLSISCCSSDTRIFKDSDSGFSIKLPSQWEKINPTSIFGDYKTKANESGQVLDIFVYMDTNTMADAFMFIKIGIPQERKGQSADEILKGELPSFYNDELIKGYLNGHEAYTFIDSIGAFNSAQGGFLWIKNETLYFALIRVFNGSNLERIYKSAKLK